MVRNCLIINCISYILLLSGAKLQKKQIRCSLFCKYLTLKKINDVFSLAKFPRFGNNYYFCWKNEET